MQNLYANEILLIVAFLFVKILNNWHSKFLVIFRWFYRDGTARAAERRTWARGQHKYYGFPVLWTPKQTEKMPQFCPNYDVISKKKKKKKAFTEILTVFPVEIWWSPNKKVFRPHMLISQGHFDGPLSSSWALCWARWSQRPSWSPWAGPLKSMGSGVIVPPCPLPFGGPGHSATNTKTRRT